MAMSYQNDRKETKPMKRGRNRAGFHQHLSNGPGDGGLPVLGGTRLMQIGDMADTIGVGGFVADGIEWAVFVPVRRMAAFRLPQN
jgi:hypothetical protein